MIWLVSFGLAVAVIWAIGAWALIRWLRGRVDGAGAHCPIAWPDIALALFWLPMFVLFLIEAIFALVREVRRA